MQHEPKVRDNLDHAVRILWIKLGLGRRAPVRTDPNLSRINWALVGMLGRQKGINAFYYLLVIVPLLLRIISKVPREMDGSANVVASDGNTYEVLGKISFAPISSDELMWYVIGYGAVIAISVGHFLFFLAAPRIFKDHANYQSLDAYIHLSRKWETGFPDKTTRTLWRRASLIRQRSCKLVAAFYCIGIAALLVFVLRGLADVVGYLTA